MLCDAKAKSIFIHESCTLEADFSAEHAVLFCFFVGRKQPNLTKIYNLLKELDKVGCGLAQLDGG